MAPVLITLEEHFLSSSTTLSDAFKGRAEIEPKLRDLGAGRLADMDRGGVSVQIISHVADDAGGPSVSACSRANDEIAAAVKLHPNRFAGFASLPVGSPEDSAKELERCTQDLGFVGALIDNHANGTFFDGTKYDVMWCKAQELDVPIYLHPTWPSGSMDEQYKGHFAQNITCSLGSSCWGWHANTGLHVLRLFASGLFDRFPKLKVVIGHMGELIPFQLQRICKVSGRWGGISRPFRQVWDENIWITTSGVWSLDPLRCVLGNTKIERILYSVDYPFETNEAGLEWMKELEASGLVTPEQLEMIAHKNAEKLLKLKVTNML